MLITGLAGEEDSPCEERQKKTIQSNSCFQRSAFRGNFLEHLFHVVTTVFLLKIPLSSRGQGGYLNNPSQACLGGTVG